MFRLFVAIEPPVAVRDALLAQMGGVAGARWQRDDQLHLTLRFIGEVDRHGAHDIVAALGAIHHPAFALTLAGRGSFEHKGRPDALWIGVAPHEPIRALNNKVEQALVRIGLAPETRTFLPHITLARLGRGTGPIAGFLSAPVLPLPPFPVDGFALYESTLGRDGADYTIVERFRLR